MGIRAALGEGCRPRARLLRGAAPPGFPGARDDRPEGAAPKGAPGRPRPGRTRLAEPAKTYQIGRVTLQAAVRQAIATAPCSLRALARKAGLSHVTVLRI